jgi:hypothetical protein
LLRTPAVSRAQGPFVSWEALFQSASPSQQNEILALASRQGLVYGHQLPTPVNGTGAPEDVGGRPLLARLLGGHVGDLEAVRAVPAHVHDSGLDARQREAVSRALSTPDICLIQGLPGTGKSRVVAEIVTQATAQGWRVLFLAPETAAIDHVLSVVAKRDVVCPLRCLGEGERAEALPPSVRSLTFTERVRALREESLHQVDLALRSQETCWRRSQEDAAALDRLEQLAGQWFLLVERRQALAQQRALCPAEVEREAAGKSDTATPRKEDTATPGSDGKPGEGAGLSCRQSFAVALAAGARAYQETLTRIDAAVADHHRLLADRRRELAEREPALQALRPLALAKEKGRWWTWTWWRATFRGNVRGRLAALEDQHKAVRLHLAELEDQLRHHDEERTSAKEAFRSGRTQLLASEIARRQGDIDERDAALEQELQILQDRWQSTCRELDGDTPRPAGTSAEAVRAVRAQWQTHLQQIEERLAFTRAWSAYLQQTAETLADRLPGFTNLVAATTTTLLADKQFGDQASLGTDFDLLVLEEAERVTEAEFLRVARRARRWVLVGSLEEPEAEIEGSRTSLKSAHFPTANRRIPASCFDRLWQYLHCDPRRLPYAWARENDRLCCRLRPLAPEQRQRLETERVVDFPEIELRILVYPRVQPLLAEVLFPPGMSMAQAKEYIFQELQELPVQAAGHSLRWVEEPGRLALHLGDGAAGGGTAVRLEPGVREMVGSDDGLTCCLEFDPVAGWQRPRAEEWIKRHLGLFDLGRTVRLDTARRMDPMLATFLSEVLFDGAHRWHPAGPLPAEQPAASRAPPVDFVMVPAAGIENGSGRRPAMNHRSRGNGTRVNFTGPGRATRGGAGLEVDLASPRHLDRLPAEFRAGLPDQGFVNYLEAQAVVRTLEKLAAEPSRPPDVLVLALYPAQVELIRRLIRRSPLVTAWGDHVSVEFAGAARQRQAAVVLISLTRSHSHRAVSYAKNPQCLVTALTRARQRLILLGDPGTLARRAQWEGPLDHLDEAAADRERQLIVRLLRYLHGQGCHPQVFQLREGSGS